MFIRFDGMIYTVAEEREIYSMKRFMGNLVLSTFAVALFVLVFVKVLKISLGSICFFAIILTVYGICLGSSRKSIKDLKKYEKEIIELGILPRNDKKVLLLSLVTLSPVLFYVFVVSLIPLQSSGLWFITVFPSVVCVCLCASAVVDEYQYLTNKKLPFVLWFIVLLVAVCLFGMFISALVLSKFIA